MRFCSSSRRASSETMGRSVREPHSAVQSKACLIRMRRNAPQRQLPARRTTRLRRQPRAVQAAKAATRMNADCGIAKRARFRNQQSAILILNQDMGFTETLTGMANRIEGCAAVVILGIDGIPIECHVHDLSPLVDIDAIATEFTTLVRRSMKTASDTELGEISEMVFATDA